jgi:hypothetical protein
MPRFVLLYHDCPPNYERASHWDFMLESCGALRTWVLEQLPHDWRIVHARTCASYPNCLSPSQLNDVSAIRLSDHRLDYLELEGPLSGNRGTVTRVAAGMYRSEHEAPDNWRLALAGDNFATRVRLSRSEGNNAHWLLQSTSY